MEEEALAAERELLSGRKGNPSMTSATTTTTTTTTMVAAAMARQRMRDNATAAGAAKAGAAAAEAAAGHRTATATAATAADNVASTPTKFTAKRSKPGSLSAKMAGACTDNPTCAHSFCM